MNIRSATDSNKHAAMLAIGGFLLAGITLANAPQAAAAPVLAYQNTSFAGSSTTISFASGTATFTLSSTGDIFNPVAITTGGTGEVSSFGGFLGIPVQPTTDFIDRGTVTFGSGDSFAAFPTKTTIPYSNGGNFLGLSYAAAGGTFYGFAEFQDTTLVGYGIETTPGTPITALDIAAPVPEPTSIGLLATALAGLALSLRGRSRHRMNSYISRMTS